MSKSWRMPKERNHGNRKYGPEVVAQWAEMRKNGMAPVAISKQEGVSITTVQNKLDDWDADQQLLH